MEKDIVRGYYRIRRGKQEDPKVEYERLQKGYGTKHPEKINGFSGLFFGRGDVFVSETVGDLMREDAFRDFVTAALKLFEKENYGDISRGDEECNGENRWLGNGDRVMGRYGYYDLNEYQGKIRYDEVIRIRTWEGNIWITMDMEPDLFILLKSSRKAPELILSEGRQEEPVVPDLEGTDFLREYRTHSEKYLPLISIQYDYYPLEKKPPTHSIPDDRYPPEVEDDTQNIFWNAGILEGNRPYFARCWKMFDVTSLDIYLSAQGMERWDAEHFTVPRLIRRGLLAVVDLRKIPPAVFRTTDRTGHEFYMVHLVLEDGKSEPNVRWIGKQYSFEELNRLNRERAAESRQT